MGATVTTGKIAAAFPGTKGTVFVLFEESYEKNCYPHTPHWGCRFIGNLEDTVARIFRYASSCEGGGLQGRNGTLSPERYITSWLEQLLNPVVMPDKTFTIKNDKSFYSAVTPENLTSVAESFTVAGFDDLAEMLLAGEPVTISLHEHSDFVVEYCKNNSAWQLIKYASPENYGWSYGFCPELGYSPVKNKAAVPKPEVFARRINDNDVLLLEQDGKWRLRGWQYRIVSDYIANSISSICLQYPGSHNTLIKAYRKAIAESPMLYDVVCHIDVSLIDRDYKLKSVEQLALKYPESFTKTSDGYVVVGFDRNLYSQLPTEATTYDVATVEATAMQVIPGQFLLVA
jgi:hypothetical protein